MTNITDAKKQKHIIAFVIESLNNDDNWKYNENNSDQLINTELGIKIKSMVTQITIVAFNATNQPAKLRISDSWFGDYSGLKKAVSARMTKCIEALETESDEAVIARFVKIVSENTKSKQ
jgi:hypothetical protein